MSQAASLSILQFLLGPICSVLFLIAAVNFLTVDRRHHIFLFFLGSIFLLISDLIQVYLFIPGLGVISQGASVLSDKIQLLQTQGLSGMLGMFLMAYGILIHALIYGRSIRAGMR